MQNNRKLYVGIRLVNPIVYYSVAIVILLNRKYLLALPLARTGSLLFIFIASWYFTRKSFDIRQINRQNMGLLLRIGAPLVPSLIVYTLFNSVDRFIVNRILGLSAVGIYSIGAKMASVSQIFQAAYAGGYQYFSFSIKDDKDNLDVLKRILNGLAFFSAAAYFTAWILAKPVFRLLYVGDYVNGYIVFPYLFLAPLLLIMFHTIRNQLLINRKSVLISVFLVIGVAVDIALNIALIRVKGIEGSAIATLTSFYVTFIILAVYAKSRNMLKLDARIFITLAIMFVFPFVFQYDIGLDCFNVLVYVFSMLVVFFLYRKEGVFYSRRILARVRSRKERKDGD